MTMNSANVRVGVTGAVYVAPLGSTPPTDQSTALDAAFADLGYVSEDGISISPGQISTNSIKAWQGSVEVRKSVTEVTNSVTFTMIETNAATLSLFLGEVIAVAANEYQFGGGTLPPRQAFVIDVVDGGDDIRYYIPEGEVSERGEMMFKNGEAIGYQVTIAAYPSSGISGRAFQAFHAKALT